MSADLEFTADAESRVENDQVARTEILDPDMPVGSNQECIVKQPAVQIDRPDLSRFLVCQEQSFPV